MRLSTVILPVYRWNEGGEVWRRAEELGFHTAYTYDHLSWRVPFRDTPWFGAVPTLTAAATATEGLRLGTMVTSPNFRHPVTLAKELMTLDDISDGRITLGIGAGTNGFDAAVLGQQEWTAGERADRFAEFLSLLDALLTGDSTTSEGRFYSAHEARNIPGCVQRPRIPFTVAGNGPRGMALAARYGESWVTTGNPKGYAEAVAAQRPDPGPASIRAQLEKLDAACAAAGRDPQQLRRTFLLGFAPEEPWQSLDAFVDFAGTYGELGIDEIVLHWPVPDTRFAADQTVFERIATEGLKQLG
ncbi:LLM class flavin-dependent oxidoreductase [Streptomyces sp. RB6PN25]|uniref:LLM class flavin-dependent oxidoreductase n=1 Tax=Streptomyces humicola TaxID=2953240 RepID=A0ABT1PYZ5_9ACTN|nr:LLM class flavin-dependent oxidoreductase [Streptomyces humicola]MCQ4081740.1 LLM class flavin-dependent oxidoreductase [Streptomyces humicola]